MTWLDLELRIWRVRWRTWCAYSWWVAPIRWWKDIQRRKRDGEAWNRFIDENWESIWGWAKDKP